MSPTSAAGALLGLSVVFVALLDAALLVPAFSSLAPAMLLLIIPALLAGNALGWWIVRGGPGPLPESPPLSLRLFALLRPAPSSGWRRPRASPALEGRKPEDARAALPAWAVGLAAFHLFGGALFDMIATIVHTPDLSFEGNAIARHLLDSGVSLPIVYVYAVTAQAGLQMLSLLGVCAWISWRPAFAAGAVAVTRQTLPLRLLIAWMPCHVLWAFIRWYLGIEWFAGGTMPRIRDEHVLPVAIPLGILLDLAIAPRLAALSGRR